MKVKELIENLKEYQKYDKHASSHEAPEFWGDYEIGFMLRFDNGNVWIPATNFLLGKVTENNEIAFELKIPLSIDKSK